MNLQKLTKEAEEYYSNEWEQSSISYEERGYYDWCIGMVQDCSSLIEIGTGIGICTEKLLRDDFEITSIENVSMNFQKSQVRLQKAGLSVNIINRQIGKKSKIAQNNLILGNFITDESLHSEILSQIEFDGIICWFVGSHPMTHMNKEMRELGYTEIHHPTYRDFIYDKLFSETSNYLPENGLISLIERTDMLTEDKKIEHIKLFSDYYKLADYGLTIDSVEQLEMENIHNLPGIRMVAYENDDLVDKENEINSFALTSTSIVKTVPNRR